jgi:hypothetical protein
MGARKTGYNTAELHVSVTVCHNCGSFVANAPLETSFEAQSKVVYGVVADFIPLLLDEVDQILSTSRSMRINTLLYDCPHVLDGA